MRVTDSVIARRTRTAPLPQIVPFLLRRRHLRSTPLTPPPPSHFSYMGEDSCSRTLIPHQTRAKGPFPVSILPSRRHKAIHITKTASYLCICHVGQGPEQMTSVGPSQTKQHPTLPTSPVFGFSSPTYTWETAHRTLAAVSETSTGGQCRTIHGRAERHQLAEFSREDKKQTISSSTQPPPPPEWHNWQLSPISLGKAERSQGIQTCKGGIETEKKRKKESSRRERHTRPPQR